MTKEYGFTCILEGTVKGNNMLEARRVVEDALLEAFDRKAAKDSNPCVNGKMKIIVGGESIEFCGNRPEPWKPPFVLKHSSSEEDSLGC